MKFAKTTYNYIENAISARFCIENSPLPAKLKNAFRRYHKHKPESVTIIRENCGSFQILFIEQLFVPLKGNEGLNRSHYGRA